ncbi:hypothetical protein KI387_012679, partial [Taxus chinensis]
IPKVAEGEETKAIETLEEEKLEHNAELLLDEEKDESVERDHGSSGGPILTVIIPKGTYTGGRNAGEERLGMGYIDDPIKVFRAWFQSTILAEDLVA